MHFMAVKKSTKRFDFVIFLYIYILNTVHCSQQLKGTQKSKVRYVKGVPFVNRRHTKGVPFWIKMVYEWVPCE